MKIAYRVQHATGRDQALNRLLPHLPPAVEVITDHEVGTPNPLRNYLRCLADPPRGATHLCVIQDDALPCTGFNQLLEEAVTARPTDPLSLFVGKLPGRTTRDFLMALKEGQPFTPVYFREIHHVVAVCWPAPLAADFLAWYDGNPRLPGRREQKSDDAVVGFWARTQKILFWAPVPCLVEHPDDLPSVIHHPKDTRIGSAGRRAIHFRG